MLQIRSHNYAYEW